MNLTIDRKRWLRGEGDECSKLLRESDKKMCCLGFYGCSLGATKDQIAGRETPTGASGVAWPEWLVSDTDHNSPECSILMSANDSMAITDTEREAHIAAIFERHGVTVRFVDEPEGE